MPKIDLDKATRDKIVHGLSRYLKDELDVEVKGFDAQFLLDFITEWIGPYYYNQGLHDAQALYQKKLEAITEAVYEIEQPIKAF